MLAAVRGAKREAACCPGCGQIRLQGDGRKVLRNVEDYSRYKNAVRCTGHRSALRQAMQRAAMGDAPHCIAQASNTRDCGRHSVRHRGKGAGRGRKGKEGRCPRPCTRHAATGSAASRAGKASERKPSRGSTMRAARQGRMGQRHEAKAQALPADGGKGISEADFWRGNRRFSRTI